MPAKKTPLLRRPALWIASIGPVAFLVCLLFVWLVVLPVPERGPVPAHYRLAAHVDPFDAGREAMQAEDWERAIAYLRQVPEGHGQYPRAQRYIGWEIYAEGMGEPRRGLDYVHRCLLEEPFEGNTWEDLGRTYASVLTGSRLRIP